MAPLPRGGQSPRARTLRQAIPAAAATSWRYRRHENIAGSYKTHHRSRIDTSTCDAVVWGWSTIGRIGPIRGGNKGGNKQKIDTHPPSPRLQERRSGG